MLFIDPFIQMDLMVETFEHSFSVLEEGGGEKERQIESERQRRKEKTDRQTEPERQRRKKPDRQTS